MENIEYLFVYGSLRSGFKSPAYEYIAPYFDLISDAKVKGTLYDMGDYPIGLPTQEERFIYGELYKLKSLQMFEWAFAQLDDYEGIVTEEDEPTMFKRESVQVFVEGGEITAWVYWYNEEITDKPIIESGDVLQYLHNKFANN